jgi:hypothetical protein
MPPGTPEWRSRWAIFAHVSKLSRYSAGAGFRKESSYVTGTTGIGMAIAKRLARGGDHVLGGGIDAAVNSELQREALSANYR